MRTRTLASLLILCGSTAALAQIAPPGQPSEPQNNITANETPAPDATPPADTPPDSSAPENKTDSGDDKPPQQP
jgi:hypothetical protein